jgi:hypothetical protein
MIHSFRLEAGSGISSKLVVKTQKMPERFSIEKKTRTVSGWGKRSSQ